MISNINIHLMNGTIKILLKFYNFNNSNINNNNKKKL